MLMRERNCEPAHWQDGLDEVDHLRHTRENRASLPCGKERLNGSMPTVACVGGLSAVWASERLAFGKPYVQHKSDTNLSKGGETYSQQD